MRFLNKLALLFAGTLISLTVSAQKTGSIKGFVYEKENGEAIIFTNVILKGTTYGVTTDVNGYYTIPKIKPGDYTIMITSLGYDTLKAPISISEDQIVTKNLYLTKRHIKLKDVEVSAARQEKTTQVRVGVTKVTPKDIQQVVSVGGEADIAQYMQTLPGVISSGDQGGQLYIRGGSPIQNKVLLDGMTIYNPFHSIGLFSVFDNDIIKNADVYTGGFGAEYGGRISSIMDIKTRDGNKKKLGGKVSVSPFMAKLLLEGPIVKQGEEGGGSSFIVSYKNSYLEQTSKSLYSYVSKDGIPYNFSDLYGKVSASSANGSKVNFFGFNFNDSVHYKGVSNLGWNSRGFGSNFVIIPGSSTVLIDGAFAYSNYNVSLQERDTKPRSSSISGFNMALNFTYFLGKNEIKYGLDVESYATNFTYYSPLNDSIRVSGTSTELVPYFKFKKIFKDRLLIEPGLHFHYYANLDEFSPEPRLGMKYNVTDYLRLKFAGGYYSQNFISASSDRDVVNLFYGFLTSPSSGDIVNHIGTQKFTSTLQKSRHGILGFELDLPYHFDLNVEGYIKDFYQLANINRDQLYPLGTSGKTDVQTKDFANETGYVKGIDFVLKYDYKQLYFWTTYSLTYVTRTTEQNGQAFTYPPIFDRRHNISVVAAYTFGKNNSWEIDGRWNLGSGFPFTQTAGFFPQQTFQNGLSTDLTKTNSDLGIIYGNYNGGRLPWYHRMDFSLKKKYEFKKNMVLEGIFSVTNVYNYSNIFYIDRITSNKVYQLPFLPSVGMSLSF